MLALADLLEPEDGPERALAFELALEACPYDGSAAGWLRALLGTVRSLGAE